MSRRAFVATRKGLFTIAPANGKWSVTNVAFLGDNVPMVFHDRRDGALYAALDHGHFGGKLHRSDNDGESWTEIAVPTYPEKPADSPPDVDGGGREIPWSLKLIWALEAGGALGELWCGTIPGGLFQSTDRGASWTINQPLWDLPERKKWFGGGADYPGIHSVCLDPRDSRTFVVGVSCGGCWLTRDNGASWEVASQGMRAEFMPSDRQLDPYIQDPHRIVQCPGSPDVFWSQHHNGIFRSTDGCKSWQEITSDRPGKSGFAVVVHPTNGDTAWFIPMVKDETRIPPDGKLVVLTTRDGGRTFEQQRTGLPQNHAYDLIFRHAMDIDLTGNVLAFGSTTGNLFVSEDGGAGWAKLAEHLPPVYAVRMA